MKQRIVLVILIIVLMATFAGSALAGPPERLRWEEPFYEVVDCGDFDIIIDSTSRITVTYFADDNNNPTVVSYQLKYTGTITNTGTGSVFPDHTVINGRRLESGERHHHGIYYHINVPGEGVVTLVAGRISFGADGEISSTAGQGWYEMFVDPGEEAMLCQTVAGH